MVKRSKFPLVSKMMTSMPSLNPHRASPLAGQFGCGVTFNSAETFGIEALIVVCE